MAKLNIVTLLMDKLPARNKEHFPGDPLRPYVLIGYSMDSFNIDELFERMIWESPIYRKLPQARRVEMYNELKLAPITAIMQNNGLSGIQYIKVALSVRPGREEKRGQSGTYFTHLSGLLAHAVAYCIFDDGKATNLSKDRKSTGSTPSQEYTTMLARGHSMPTIVCDIPPGNFFSIDYVHEIHKIRVEFPS